MYKRQIFVISLIPFTTAVAQVPADVVDRIMQKAAENHPDDYSTQEYVVKVQTKSFLELATLAATMKSRREKAILRKALSNHPDDYSTQVYVIKEQLKSLERLNALGKAVNPPLATYPSSAWIIKQLTELGMHQELTWRKSQVDPGWIGQFRFFNGKIGEGLSSAESLKSADQINEVNCQLVGPDQSGVSEIRFEIEIYDPNYEVQSREIGKKVAETVFPPGPMTKAFFLGKESKGDNWHVKKARHPKGGGYNVVATVGFSKEIQNPKKFFKGAREAVKQYVIEQSQTPNAADFFYDEKKTKYIGDTSFMVTGSVDDNIAGKLTEQNFECVVKIKGRYWQVVSFKVIGWKNLSK